MLVYSKVLFISRHKLLEHFQSCANSYKKWKRKKYACQEHLVLNVSLSQLTLWKNLSKCQGFKSFPCCDGFFESFVRLLWLPFSGCFSAIIAINWSDRILAKVCQLRTSAKIRAHLVKNLSGAHGVREKQREGLGNKDWTANLRGTLNVDFKQS